MVYRRREETSLATLGSLDAGGKLISSVSSLTVVYSFAGEQLTQITAFAWPELFRPFGLPASFAG